MGSKFDKLSETNLQMAEYARRRLSRGASREAIVDYLVGEGMVPSAAETLVAGVLRSLRLRAFTEVITGAVLSVLGLAIGVAVHRYTEGMLVLIWYGAMPGGILLAIDGFIRLQRFAD